MWYGKKVVVVSGWWGGGVGLDLRGVGAVEGGVASSGARVGGAVVRLLGRLV